jgi:sulfatase maturation enzyme AslB (radical SAM superfamily)
MDEYSVISLKKDNKYYYYNFNSNEIIESNDEINLSSDSLNFYFKENFSQENPDENVSRIQFFTTLNCNLKCSYCFNSSSYSSSCLSKGIVDSTLNYIANEKKDFVFIHFIGGEPTLNIEMIEYIVMKSNELFKHPDFHIISNGVFDKRIIDLIIEKDFDVTISLDGVKRVNDKFRFYPNGKSCFDKITNNIKTLSKENIRLTIRTTITPHLYNSIEEYIDMLVTWKITRLRLEPMLTSAGRASENRIKSITREFSDFYYRTLKYSSGKPIKIENTLSKYLKVNDARFKRPLIVLPNGDITASPVVCNPNDTNYPKFIYGSINANQIDFNLIVKDNLKTIFNDNYAKHCIRCQIKNICLGRLRGYDFSFNSAIGGNYSNICEQYLIIFEALLINYVNVYKPNYSLNGLSIWQDVEIN